MVFHCLPTTYSKGNCHWEEQDNIFGRVFKGKWQLIFLISATRSYQKRPAAFSGGHCAIAGIWKQKESWLKNETWQTVGLNCLLPLQSKYNPLFRNSSKGVLCVLTYQQMIFPFPLQFLSKISYLIFLHTKSPQAFCLPQTSLRASSESANEAAERHLNTVNTYSLCILLTTRARSTDHHTFSFLSALQSKFCSQSVSMVLFCSMNQPWNCLLAFESPKALPEGLGRFTVLDWNCRIWQFQPGKNWQPTLRSLGMSMNTLVGFGLRVFTFL